MLNRIISRLKQHFYQELFDERAFDIYIRSQGSIVQQSDNTFPIVDKLHELIASNDILSLLILGEPGLGKTLLSYHLAHLYWHFNKIPGQQSLPHPLWVPVWIYLPSFSEAEREKNLLRSYWKKQPWLSDDEIKILQTACQQDTIRLLIIIDGLDEIRLPQKNFYLSNGWFQLEWPQVKVVTFSRPEAFTTLVQPIDYQRLFYTQNIESLESSNTFKELYLQPFSEEEIDSYLQEFVKKICLLASDTLMPTPQGWQNWETYKQTLQKVSPLAELAKNPFVLSIMVKSLPAIVIEAKNDEGYIYTRERIYHLFIQSWLKNQAEERIWKNTKYKEQLQLAGMNDIEQLISCLWTYSENLARFALNEGKGKLDVLLSEENTLRVELVQKSNNMSSYFYKEQISETIMQIIRSGCLLKFQGQVYRFLHKTIVEFFAARAIFNGVHVAIDAYLNSVHLHQVQNSFSLNDHNLLTEPQVIKMLADLVNTDGHFKKMLYDVIEFSKQEILVKIASANAITILNAAGEIFNNKDFRGIQIPEADLTGAICDHTDFSNADLSNVCLEKSWLHQAKLKGANLLQVSLGELPLIKNDKEISSMTICLKNFWLFTGDMSGTITQWNLRTNKKLSSWRATASATYARLGGFVGLMPITALTLSPSSEKIAYATQDGAVHVSDLNGCNVKHIISTTAQTHEKMLMAGVNVDKRGVIIDKIYFLSYDENIIIFYDAQIFLDHRISSQGLGLWDIQKGNLIKSFQSKFYRSFTLDLNGRFLAYIIDDQNKLTVHDLKENQQVFQQAIRGEICAFSTNGKWLAFLQYSQDHSNTLLFYEVENWHLAKSLRVFNEEAILSDFIAFTPDERMVVCIGSSSMSVWHIESGKCLYNFPHVISTNQDPNWLPPILPIIISLPSESKLPRMYHARNNVIDIFEINITTKIVERKSKCIQLKDQETGTNVAATPPTCGLFLFANTPEIEEAFLNFMQHAQSSLINIDFCSSYVFVENEFYYINKNKNAGIVIKKLEIKKPYNAKDLKIALECANGSLNGESYLCIQKKLKDKFLQKIKLMTGHILTINASHEIDINLELIEYDKVNRPPLNYLAKLKIFKNEQFYCEFIFLYGVGNPYLFLSPNRRYLIFTLKINIQHLESVHTVSGARILNWLSGLALDSDIKVFDLESKKQSFTFKHHNQITSMLFSNDSEWLITTAGFTVRIWDMATGKCLYRYKKIEKWADAIALSQNKEWLAIADGCRNVCIWNTRTYNLIFTIKEVPQRIYHLAFSIDNDYLECNPGSKHRFVYKITSAQKEQIYLQLIERSLSANFYCLNAKVNESIIHSENYSELFLQRRADGIPRLAENNVFESSFVLNNAIQYPRPIIEKLHYSIIYQRLPITYDNWVISLLRDTKSTYPSHTFLLVEGMNAWGRLQLYRYDLATMIHGEAVQAGYAKVVHNTFQGLSWENFRSSLLSILKINQQEHSLESIVGHAWSLSRVKCLSMHKAILSDKNKGLIPYSNLGDNSLLSQGIHNCYTWCRAHLIKLNEPNINKDIPLYVTDYIGAHPKFYLRIPPRQVQEQRKNECLVM